MSKFASNEEIMNHFKEIEVLKKSDEKNKELKIKNIRNTIIQKMSPSVEYMTKRYKKFNNYEDVQQEGFVGLIKAVDRFDYTRFPNFFVYSQQWIFNHICLAARKFDVVYSKTKQRTVYCEIEPEVEENNDPESAYIRDEKNSTILEILNNLNERESMIIKSLYGIGEKKKTLRQIGKTMDLSYERVRQLGDIAIKKLNNNKKINLLQNL